MDLIWSVPVAVLLIAALIILLINRTSPNIGAAWFAAILAGVFVWGWTVSLYYRPDIVINPLPKTVDAFSTRAATGSFVFVLDSVSYPFMLSVSALLVILMLTAPSYMEPQTAPRLWFFYLLIEAIGFLSVSANDVTFIIYGWIIFDGIDLAAQYLQARPGRIRRGFLTAVGVRFIGTLLAASSLALSNSELPGGLEAFITPHAGAYLVTACALRMGIIPVSQPYGEMSESRVGLGTMLRLVSALTVIPVLCRIPMSGMRPDLVTLLIIAGGFAALTGAVGWLLSESSFSGISYAALSVCSIAFLCALNGEQNALIVWGISIALTCGPLSLYQIRNRFMNIVAFLGIAVFAGLPYMPNAHGWSGLIRSHHAVQNLMYILVLTLLIAGSFVHVFRTEGKKFSELEPWMRSVYPLGFFAAIGTHVFIGMTSFGGQFSLWVIPASVSVFTGGISLALLSVYLPESVQTQNAAAWGRALLSFFWRAMRKMMDMEWLISIAGRVSWALRTLALTVSEVLENNGGLIWELLLMALLIAAAFGGGQF